MYVPTGECPELSLKTISCVDAQGWELMQDFVALILSSMLSLQGRGFKSQYYKLDLSCIFFCLEVSSAKMGQQSASYMPTTLSGTCCWLRPLQLIIYWLMAVPPPPPPLPVSVAKISIGRLIDLFYLNEL